MVGKITDPVSRYFNSPYWVDISPMDYPGDKNIWSKIDKWIYKNCHHRRMVGTRVISQNHVMYLPCHMVTYYFENREDAINFELYWKSSVEITLRER